MLVAKEKPMTTTAKLKAALALVFVGGLTIGLALGTNGVPGFSVASAQEAEGNKPMVSPTQPRARDFYAPNSEPLKPDEIRPIPYRVRLL